MSAIGVYLAPVAHPPARVADQPWRGVFVGDDEAPEAIASWIAGQVLEREGDLPPLVEKLIPSDGVGWASMLTGLRLDEAEDVRVGPGHLEDTTFVYLFDVEGRRLDVFATHSDASGERVGRLSFDEVGRVGPWELETPVPPRLLSPVWPRWTGSKHFADAESRRDDRLSLQRALEARGVAAASAIAALARGMSARWRSACGGASRALLPPAEVSGFWDVRLPEIDVWYPVPGQRHEVYASPSELLLFAERSGVPHVVRIAFDTMAEDLDLDEAIVDALREVTNESGWVFLVLDLLRGEQVPETPVPSST